MKTMSPNPIGEEVVVVYISFSAQPVEVVLARVSSVSALAFTSSCMFCLDLWIRASRKRERSPARVRSSRSHQEEVKITKRSLKSTLWGENAQGTQTKERMSHSGSFFGFSFGFHFIVSIAGCMDQERENGLKLLSYHHVV